MTTQQITSTRQINFAFDTHCFGACANAAKDIANGNTVKFDVFTRPNKEDSTELKYKSAFYFGIADIDGKPALMVSHCSDLDAHQSHSLIASWNDSANDPVFIAARLTLFLSREGSDWFIGPVLR
jgi:hypothetical protein